MKKGYKAAVTVLSLLLSATVLIGGARMLHGRADAARHRVVASFYPIYIAAKNLTQGIGEIETVNLTRSQTGCLHDFTLRPQDMVTLEGAEVLLINGGGMESFLDNVMHAYPDLPVVDSSAGLEVLADDEAHSLSFGHDHGEEDHDDEPNAHFWLSPTRYAQQVQNLRDGLIRVFPQYREQLEQNADAYLAQIAALRSELSQAVPDSAQPVIILHNAFAYLAADCGLSVAETIQVERDTALSAAQIAQAIDRIRTGGSKLVLAEPQYSAELADAIARETQAQVVTLSIATSGPDEPDAYLDIMKENCRALMQAFAAQSGGGDHP